MMEIFTIGGGEYIVNVFNAVSAWTGGGGFRSLLRVVMVMGLIYTLLVVAFSLDWRAWFNWFLGATLMYGALIVPTMTVRVHGDRHRHYDLFRHGTRGRRSQDFPRVNPCARALEADCGPSDCRQPFPWQFADRTADFSTALPRQRLPAGARQPRRGRW